jgi:hypothetical protein
MQLRPLDACSSQKRSSAQNALISMERKSIISVTTLVDISEATLRSFIARELSCKKKKFINCTLPRARP